MKDVTREITKEEYEQAQLHGADNIISDFIKNGYGVYASGTFIEGDKYYLYYTMGDSCD